MQSQEHPDNKALADEGAKLRAEVRQQFLDRIQNIPTNPINPMFSEKLSANVLDYLPEGKSEPTRNRHGQPIVKPQGVNFVRWDTEAIVLSNLEYEHNIPESLPERIFCFPQQVPDPGIIIDESYQMASSIYSKDGNILFSHRIGPPLQCIDVPIVIVPGSNWSIGDEGAGQ